METAESSDANTSQDHAIALPNHPCIQAADDARILVAKRRRAVDALELDEEVKQKISDELDDQGWPTDLASNAARQIPASVTHDVFGEADVRGLLCFKRHCAHLEMIHIRNSFFWTRGVNARDPCNALRNRWSYLRKEVIEGWDENNDSELQRLYGQVGRSFNNIAESQIFGDFPAVKLETRYAQIIHGRGQKKKGAEGENTGRSRKGKRMKGKGKQVQSDTDEDEEDEDEGGE